jgi:thiamine-monophosphate kinase
MSELASKTCSGVPTEFELIAWIRDRSHGNEHVRIGIGDDCAVLRLSAGREALLTTDMLMDGRHFRLDQTGPEAVGYKALAVNLSDIAAMAGVPLAAFVAIAFPKHDLAAVASGIHAGMQALAERFGVSLAGGDTNAWDGPLVISVTLLGETTASGPVTRSGARAGDAIFVTGPVGGSLLGRHMRPWPRVAEALELQRTSSLHAMIDISDGLAGDLGHVLDESGRVGATLDATAIPIHADAHTISGRDGRSALEHALNDGEDFELCFMVGPEDAERLESHAFGGFRPVRIGRIDERPGLRLRMHDGRVENIVARGFDHLAV